MFKISIVQYRAFLFLVKRSHFYLWILSVFPWRLTRVKTNSLYYFYSSFFTIFWRNTVKSNVKCKSPVSGVLQYLLRNWKMIWKLIYYLSVHLSKREAVEMPRNSFSIRKFCMIRPFCQTFHHLTILEKSDLICFNCHNII